MLDTPHHLTRSSIGIADQGEGGGHVSLMNRVNAIEHGGPQG